MLEWIKLELFWTTCTRTLMKIWYILRLHLESCYWLRHFDDFLYLPYVIRWMWDEVMTATATSASAVITVLIFGAVNWGRRKFYYCYYLSPWLGLVHTTCTIPLGLIHIKSAKSGLFMFSEKSQNSEPNVKNF